MSSHDAQPDPKSTSGISRPAANEQSWHPATRMVHCGSDRSHHGETSEALYLTQGFVYDNAEQAEARFSGEEPGFVYSRYANPTVSMFEERMCAMEGAEACLATASGMAAISAALMCGLKAGDHIVLKAHQDCIAIMSACPQDMTPVNGVGTEPGHLEFVLEHCSADL